MTEEELLELIGKIGEEEWRDATEEFHNLFGDRPDVLKTLSCRMGGGVFTLNSTYFGSIYSFHRKQVLLPLKKKSGKNLGVMRCQLL